MPFCPETRWEAVMRLTQTRVRIGLCLGVLSGLMSMAGCGGQQGQMNLLNSQLACGLPPQYCTAGLLLNPEPAMQEAYDHIVENDFLRVTAEPLSTFSINVDTASYSNVRRFLIEKAAAAEGRGSHRGIHQLLPVRLSPAPGRASPGA